MSLSEQFVSHESCPKCGSRDNLGRYADGHAFCFGCRHREPPTRDSTILSEHLLSLKEGLSQTGTNVKPLPEDSSRLLSVKSWTWLKKYGILNEETKDFLWSDIEQWLIYPIYDSEKRLLAWQARNFQNPILGKKFRKYFTYGPISDIMCIIGSNEPIVIVEDMLSAIKVGRQFSAIPMFGSNVPLKTLVRLKDRFKLLRIWLDKDKTKEGMDTMQRAQQLGFPSVDVIMTELDPKKYDNAQIQRIVEG